MYSFNNKLISICLLCVLMLLADYCIAASFIDRRRPQKSAIPNRYYLVPWVINIEGIGLLWGGVGGVANLYDSGTNAAFINFQNGNFHVKGWGIDDFFLVGDYNSFASITLSGGYTRINLKEFDVYDVGRDSSDKSFKVNGYLKFQAAQLQLRLFKDRIKLSTEAYMSHDSIYLADNPVGKQESKYGARRTKLEFDFTDDRYDSRIGIRGMVIHTRKDPNGNVFTSNNDDEVYENLNQELSLFIPLYISIENQHTLAINYSLLTHNNLNPEIPSNRRGGGELGGPVRMRGYPNGRFVDNNMLYYCLEYRWTIKDDFGTGGGDFILSNDSLEGLQFAFFHEWGQVSEFNDASLHKDMKTNFGFGIRAVWDSSLVMRLDIGFSEEGSGTTFLIMQPF